MSLFNNPLYDKDFLYKLDHNKNKEIFVKIIALTFDERPVESIEGRVTSGSINIDGASAIRRTCSLSLVAKELNINDFYWGLNNKFKLEVGLKNLINPNYPDIIWFKQGTYAITSFSTNQTTNNYTISISGKDKGCFINGEIGGNIPASVDFGVEEYVDKENNITNYYKIPIKKIIQEMLHTYALELYHNIIINDLETAGLELLEYRGEEPLYLLYSMEEQEFVQVRRATDKNLIVYFKDNDGKLKEIGLNSFAPDQYLTLIKNKQEIGESNEGKEGPLTIRLSKENPLEYQVAKLEYGQTAGYRLTQLVYAGDLIANVGDTITSVLDKIKNMLGEFEYFYDLDGRFVFQAKKTYINNIFNNKTQNEDEGMFIENSAYNDQFIYKFEGGNLISSYQNAPNLSNLKNDFSVWGNRKTIDGTEIPIHYRYAIDKKPTYYKTWDRSDSVEPIEYYTQIEDIKQDYPNNYNELIEQGKIIETDWREIIYQMTLDYYKYNQKEEFLTQLANQNIRRSKNISEYPDGTTGYERYYIDMQGFWRQLYDPQPESIYSDKLNNDQTETFKYISDLYPKGLYTKFKYEKYDEANEEHKKIDRKNIEVLWQVENYEKVATADEKAEDFVSYYILKDDKYVLASIESESYDDRKTYYKKVIPNYMKVKSPLKKNMKDYFIEYSDYKLDDEETYNAKKDYYEEYFYEIPQKTWNGQTWNATNFDLFRQYYRVKTYEIIKSITSKETFNNYREDGSKIYIKDEEKYQAVKSSDYYSKKNDYYIIGYDIISEPSEEKFKDRKTKKETWYTLSGDVYSAVSTSASFSGNLIYYKQVYKKVENPQINFKENKSKYFIKLPITYSEIKTYNDKISIYYSYQARNINEGEGYNSDYLYCFKTYRPVKVTNSSYKASKYYILTEKKYIQPSEINLNFDGDNFDYYKINHKQLQPLLNTIPVSYDGETKYYIACQISEETPDGFKEITKSAQPYIEKDELFLKIEDESDEKYIYTKVKATDQFDDTKIYCTIDYNEIVFLNSNSFNPKDYDYYTKSTKGTYEKVKSTDKFNDKKIYYEAVYTEVDKNEINQEELTNYYIKKGETIYLYKTLLQMAEPAENWYVKIEDQNDDYYNIEDWLIKDDFAIKEIFIKSIDNNELLLFNYIKQDSLLLDATIDESASSITVYIDFYTQDYNYYENGENKHWNKAVYESPDSLNFWIDFLDSDGELSQYNIKAVGDRSKVVNDKDVKSIYFRDVPNIIYMDSKQEQDEENENDRYKMSDDELMELSSYWHYTRIRNIPMTLFTVSAQGKSAQDALDSLLYNHSYCIESINLQAIPIYYLEPNTRILVYDDMSKINGEYLVSKISLPLSYNGMMTINATKAPTRLY